MTVNRAQLALIHVAVGKLGLTDAQYRSALAEIGGVTTSTALDRDGFDAMMGYLRWLGFDPAAPKGQTADNLLEAAIQSFEAATGLDVAEASGSGLSGVAGSIASQLAGAAANAWDIARGLAAAAANQANLDLNASRRAYGKLVNTYGGGADAARASVWHLNAPPPPVRIDRPRPVGGGTAGGGAGGGGTGGGGAVRDAAEELRRAADDAARALEDARDRLVDELKEGFTSPFEDFISGASDAKEAFDDFGNFVQRKLAEIIANQVWEGLFAGPVSNLVNGSNLGGGILGQLLGGVFGGLFATGAAPLSAMANSVVGTPTLFGMGDGRTGVLGEDGDEAILPLRGQGALALLPGGGEVRLPLARGAGGDMGIALPPDLVAALQPFARGGAPRFAMPGAPDLPSYPRSPTRPEGVSTAPAIPSRERINLTMVNNGEPMQATAEVRQTGDDVSIEVIMERIDTHLARNAQTGRGAFVPALQRAMGLRRQGQ